MATKRLCRRLAANLLVKFREGEDDLVNLPVTQLVSIGVERLGFGPPTREADEAFVGFLSDADIYPEGIGGMTDGNIERVLLALTGLPLQRILVGVYTPLWR